MCKRRQVWCCFLTLFLTHALEGGLCGAPLTVKVDTGLVRVTAEEGSAAPADNNEEESDKKYSEGEPYDEEGVMEDEFPLGTWEDEETGGDAPEGIFPEGSEGPEGSEVDDKKK